MSAIKPDQESPEQVLAAAEAWLARQKEVLSKSLGSRWVDHREWVEAYLLQEIRERLIARGWRPKQ